MGKNMDSCFVTGIVGKFDVFSFFCGVGVEGSTVGRVWYQWIVLFIM